MLDDSSRGILHETIEGILVGTSGISLGIPPGHSAITTGVPSGIFLGN